MTSSSWSCLVLLLLLLSSLRLYQAMHYQIQDNKLLSCPVGFSLHNSSCYKFFGTKTRQTFYHALKRCSSHHASLVTIHSAEEQDFVVQLTENMTAFWIGLNDFIKHESKQPRNPVFKWTTGQILNHTHSFHNWKPGEPVDHKHVDCVKCDYTGWSVAQGGCGSCKLPYICQKQACPESYEWMGMSCEPIAHTDTSTNTQPTKSRLVAHRKLAPTKITIFSFITLLVLLVTLSIAVVHYTFRTRPTVEDCHWRTASSEESCGVLS